MVVPAFETVFVVPLSCEACIKDVSTSLYKLPGVSEVRGTLGDQTIAVRGNAAPSAMVSAIQESGRDAILRGSGKSDSAAVCILETHSTAVSDPVRGLIRMVQVAPAMTIIDMSVQGVSAGTYHVSVREAGDISAGPESTGDVWDLSRAMTEGQPETAKGIFGSFDVGENGRGSFFIDRALEVWQMIGRSIVVSRQHLDGFSKHDPDTLVGVIARSAGIWDNDKTVCSCSGKTVWEERREQVGRGMV